MAIAVAAILLLLAACREQKPQPRPGAAAPQVRATVITIQTAIQPANRTLTHTVSIAADRARSSDELDQWRLYDLKGNRVTYVDDIGKTYRHESMSALIARRRAALAREVPPGVAPAQFAVSGSKKLLQGVPATQAVVRAGRYQRELWIGLHPAIPPTLFSMMHAAEIPTSAFAPMMRTVDAALLATRGFPLADHAELPFDDKKMVVDRTVVKIESREIPAAYLEIPRGYKDVTPVPKPPAAKRR